MKNIGLLLFVVGILFRVQGQQVRENFSNKVNGPINAVEVDDENGILYLGGDFTRVGNMAKNGAVLDSKVTEFENTGNQDQPNDIVFTSSPDGNGGFYIGGRFSAVGNETRNRLAHIDEAGKVTKWAENLNLNGNVRAIYVDDEKLYIGGSFTSRNAIRIENGVSLNLLNGKPEVAFPPVNGHVQSTAPDGSGGYYIGGYFTEVGGKVRRNLAHIDENGEVTSWNPSANHVVSVIERFGNRVFVGGTFDQIGGERRNGIAALDVVTGNATEWNTEDFTSVKCLAISDNTLYIGGSFRETGGQGRNYLAALDIETGAVLDWNPNANGLVSALAVKGETLYAGGNFTEIGGQSKNYLAALDTHTGQVIDWDPNPDGPIYTLATSDNSIYVGGFFKKIVGIERNNLASFELSSREILDWNPNANGSVRSINVFGNNVYIGGDFVSVGGQIRSNIAALDIVSGNATNWNPILNSSVNSVAISGNTIYAGGRFSFVGGEQLYHIACLDRSSGDLINWNPSINSPVTSIAVSDDKNVVYVGGGFTEVGGQSRERLAAIDVNSAIPLDWNPKVNSLINSMLIADNTMYIGGFFNEVNNEARNHIAAINLSDGTLLDWNPNANSSVNSMAISDSHIFVGGFFTEIGSQQRNFIAALDLVSGNVTSWNPDPNSAIYSIVLSENLAYIGGFFNEVGGQERKYLAAIDTATGSLTNWSPYVASTLSIGASIHTLSISENFIYAGGFYTQIGGKVRNSLVAMDANTGAILDWSPSVDGNVDCLAISDGTIYIGGEFNSINNLPRKNIGAIEVSSGSTTTWAPDANAKVTSLEMSERSVYAGGHFTHIGGQSRNYIAELNKADASATTWNPNANGEVRSIIKSNDVVYAGGAFTQIGGQSRGYVGALDPVTGMATAWNPSANSHVNRLYVDGDNVYVGGFMSFIGGQPRSGIAALDAATGNATNWNPNPDGIIQSITKSGTTVYFGGTFREVGGKPRDFIAGVDEITGMPTKWNPGADSWVTDLSFYGHTIFAGGLFENIGGQPVRRFAGLSTDLFQSITFDGLPKVDYATRDFKLRAMASSGLSVHYTSSNDQVASVSGQTISIKGVGAATITAMQDGDADYPAASPVTKVLVVDKAPLAVTAENKVRVYGAENPALTVLYEGFVGEDDAGVLDEEPIVSTSADVSSGAGDYDISVSGGSDDNYFLHRVDGLLTVEKAPLTVTAENKVKVYGAENPALTVLYEGFVGEDDAGVLDEGPLVSTLADVSSGAGDYDISVSGGSDDNYFLHRVDGLLTVEKAPLTVMAENKVKVYGAENPALTVLYEGFVGEDDAGVLDEEPIVSTSADVSSGAGDYDISVSGGSDDNYFLHRVDGLLTVEKAPLTVTAENKVKVYGAENPALTVLYEGFVGEDDAGVLDEGPLVSTLADVSSGAGDYDISVSGGSDDNYFLHRVDGLLTVEKAPLTVMAENKVKVYGAENPALTVLYEGFVGEDDAGVLDEDPLVSTLADVSSGAGDYDISVSGGSDDNYVFKTLGGTLTISKADLEIIADDKVMTRGEQVPELSMRVTGFVNGDSEVDIVLPDVSTSVTPMSPVGEYAILLSGGSATNYELNLINGKLTVEEVLGLIEEEQVEFIVYPNPALSNISVSNSNESLKALTIYDLKGNRVKHFLESQEKYDVQHLKPGVYLLQLEFDEDIQYVKFVKK